MKDEEEDDGLEGLAEAIALSKAKDNSLKDTEKKWKDIEKKSGFDGQESEVQCLTLLELCQPYPAYLHREVSSRSAKKSYFLDPTLYCMSCKSKNVEGLN